jgi:tetratricopeptide (TPR) repeat protein
MNLNLTPLLTQAYKAFQSGQLDIAQGLAAKVLSIQSNNFDALYLSGVIHGIKGQHDIAAKQLKKAVALAPQHPFAHFNLAKALMEQGRNKDALEHLKKSITVEPNNPDAELNLGLCLIKLNNYGKTLKKKAC